MSPLTYIFCALIFLMPTAVSGAGAPKKVLLLQSYHKEYPWVAAITKGVKKAFEGADCEIAVHYMDTQRNSSHEFKLAAGRLACEKIDSWMPDVVIACDDNSQIFVTRKYAGKRPFFVFCGVNSDPGDYGFPASNVTGVLESPHYVESIAFLKEICGNVKRMTVISDRTPTSVGALEFMRRQSVAVTVERYYLSEYIEVWQELVREANKTDSALAVYLYHTVMDADQVESIPPARVMSLTKEICKIPTVGFFEFAIEDGILCGVVESGEEHGYQAGLMARELLDGKDIRTMPIKTALKGRRMLNMSAARALRIDVPSHVLKTVDRIVE